VTDKAPEAFRTISEVAEQLDVPQHVLSFWETRFSQIRPMKRGGGRRYYRPEDVDLLKGIRTLLYGEGYTIRGAQKILKENGVAHVVGIGRGEISVEAGDGKRRQAPAHRQQSRNNPNVKCLPVKAQAERRPGWSMNSRRHRSMNCVWP
jgi:DNA-binding transcriptional MerR regulator